jgi:hypothetical protein
MKQISLVILRTLEKKRGGENKMQQKPLSQKKYFYEQIQNLPISSNIHCHPDGL